MSNETTPTNIEGGDRPNLLPPLDQTTEAALRESIGRFGVLVPIVRDQHGRVLDGRHRARIAEELGVTCRVDVIPVESEEQARELEATLNAARRQLDVPQRREIVAALREQGFALRAIAGAVGASEPTVRRDVNKAIASGDAIAPDRVKRQGGGSYPAKRPPIIAAKNELEARLARVALRATGVPDGGVLHVRDLATPRFSQTDALLAIADAKHLPWDEIDAAIASGDRRPRISRAALIALLRWGEKHLPRCKAEAAANPELSIEAMARRR